jgi:hypothetical protein
VTGLCRELAKSGPPKTPPAEVPVTLAVVYRDSHAPVAHTIFTVRDSAGRIIHQEVMSDATGSAKFHLFPGKYELLTTGANENLTFVVTTIETTITVQVEPRASAAPTEFVTTTETYYSDNAASGACKDFGAWASVCTPDKPAGWTITYEHFDLTGDRAGCQWAEECGHSDNTGIHYSKGVLTIVWKHPA